MNIVVKQYNKNGCENVYEVTGIRRASIDSIIKVEDGIDEDTDTIKYKDVTVLGSTEFFCQIGIIASFKISDANHKTVSEKVKAGTDVTVATFTEDKKGNWTMS